jgi:CRP-like cAMP-binding protein
MRRFQPERRSLGVHPGARVRLFEADPDLSGTTLSENKERLRAVTVPVRSLEVGPWLPRVRTGEPALGFLVLEGAISLETRLYGRTAVEVLGPGDPFLPAEESDPDSLLYESSWMVVSRSELAILDAAFTNTLRLMPEVSQELMRRTRASARALRRQHAIAGIPDVAQRLLAMLWHLGDRWGRPEEGSVVLEVRLTHDVLAHLIHCARETLSRRLGRLRENGLVSIGRDGFLVLHGLPPIELEHLEAATAASRVALDPKL